MQRRAIGKSGNISIFWRYGGGLLLALIAAVGLGQATRAAWAYAVMYEANFGESRRDPDTALSLSYQAHRKYPFSYHLAINAGKVAWDQYILAADRGDSEQAEYYLGKVRYWARIGLHRNPYPLQLRWFNKRLLEIDESIEAAIDYWERHTDWQFWYAYNHAVLADLYTHAGRFDDAERALRMLRRSPELHREASAALKAARENEGQTE